MNEADNSNPNVKALFCQSLKRPYTKLIQKQIPVIKPEQMKKSEANLTTYNTEWSKLTNYAE